MAGLSLIGCAGRPPAKVAYAPEAPRAATPAVSAPIYGAYRNPGDEPMLVAAGHPRPGIAAVAKLPPLRFIFSPQPLPEEAPVNPFFKLQRVEMPAPMLIK